MIIYLHRGPADGKRLRSEVPTAPYEINVPSGTATTQVMSLYRRTNWFRDDARIYMPATMVEPDGRPHP